VQIEQAQKLGDSEVVEWHCRCLWSLKESYLKARGHGLLLAASQAEFQSKGLLYETCVSPS
jgi:phosphopantetheinyl transferase